MKYLSESAKRLTGQPMFRLLDKVKEMEKEGKDFIHFEIGDPDFCTAKSIKDECILAIQDNFTHYTSSSGIEDLKKAISTFLFRTGSGFLANLDQIVIAPGCNPLIYCIIKCLVNDYDAVAIPDPGFSTYESVLKFLNIDVIKIPLKEENNFNIDLNDIEDLSHQVKLVILNFPNNPTGAIIEEARNAEEIASILHRKGMYLLSDEIYSFMIYDDNDFYSPCYKDRCQINTILISGFSKTFAMSGWRLGYMVGPNWLAEKVALLLQTIVSCPNSFVQKAGIEAYERIPGDIFEQMRELKQRRDMLVEGLNSLKGVSCLTPKGAFYVFPNIKETGMTSREFADKMLDYGVALLPGTDFGANGEGYVRLAYTTSRKSIREGIERMRKAL